MNGSVSWFRTAPGRLGAMLLFLCAAVLFADLGGAHLQNPDEGRYTEAAREMLESGDWLVPRFAYNERLNKPPLTYWVIAGFFKLLGPTELAARLGPALAGLLTGAAVFALGAALFGVEAGAASAVVVLTCAWFVAVARAAVTDMLLCLFLTLSLAALYRAWKLGTWGAYLLCFAAAAGATLVKGPLGLGLPGLVGVVYLTATRNWKCVRWERVAVGLALYLLIAAPWFLAVQARYSGFLRYTFLSENLQRYAGKYHQEPFYYYVPVLVLGVSTWLLPIADAVRRDWRAAGRRDETIDRGAVLFPWIWFVVTFLFFSVSKGKLLTYVIPCFPPLALIAGKEWADAFSPFGGTREAGARRSVVLGTAALLAALVLAALVFALLLRSKQWTDGQRLAAGAWVAAAGIAGVAACLWGLRGATPRALFSGLAAAALCFVLGGEQALAQLYRNEDVAPMAEYAAAHAALDSRILMFRTEKMTAFRFYLGRALGSARRIEDLPPLRKEGLYADSDEPAERGERRTSIAEDFTAAINSAPSGFCLMRKSDLGRFGRRLETAGWTLQPLSSRKYVLVAKEPGR